METAGPILVVALVLGAVWLALRPRYVFVVRVRDGRPHVERGRVAAPFLAEMADALDSAAVSAGWVGGVRRGRGVVLAFSRDVPGPCRQRLRNLWQIYR